MEAAKTYSYEEVLKASKTFFGGDEQKTRAWMEQTLTPLSMAPEVMEVRPQTLECDVVRFQNNKEKWEGIMLPKSVTKGKIIKQQNPDGTKRYDFQFENMRGYKITVEGLSEKFNPEYWNYAKLISGVLRYRMPLDHVIKLVSSLQLQSDSINTWKNGVERALKKYVGEDENNG